MAKTPIFLDHPSFGNKLEIAKPKKSAPEKVLEKKPLGLPMAQPRVRSLATLSRQMTDKHTVARHFTSNSGYIHALSSKISKKSHDLAMAIPTTKLFATKQHSGERQQVRSAKITTRIKTTVMPWWQQRKSLPVTTVIVYALALVGSLVATYPNTTNKATDVASTQTTKLNETAAQASPAATPKVQELDETAPLPVKGYATESDVPKRLTIAKIGVDSIITKQSVGASGEVTVPLNVHTVGWFDGSDKPADTGAVLLMGQVAGPTKDGVFKKLDKLAEGDLITLERGDGKIYYYSVVMTQKYKDGELDPSKVLAPINSGKAGLNLVTFSGSLSAERDDYSGRLVVYAQAL